MEIIITDSEILDAFGKYVTLETFVIATLIDRGAPLKIRNPAQILIKRDLKLETDLDLTDGYKSMLYYYDEVNHKHIWRFEKESQGENIQ